MSFGKGKICTSVLRSQSFSFLVVKGPLDITPYSSLELIKVHRHKKSGLLGGIIDKDPTAQRISLMSSRMAADD